MDEKKDSYSIYPPSVKLALEKLEQRNKVNQEKRNKLLENYRKRQISRL